MSSVNKVTLMGNFGKPPEITYTQSGIPVCRLGLATTDQWTDQSGERKEETQWHNLVFWKKQAENVARYCAKGSKVYTEGRLKTRSWDDEQGKKQYRTEVHVDVVKFLDKKREESPPPGPRTRSVKPLDVPNSFGDAELGDLPF